MPRQRLGHEGGVHTLLDCNLFDDCSEGHDVVRSGQRVGVTKVDLVLARVSLMVAELHRDAEVFEHPH